MTKPAQNEDTVAPLHKKIRFHHSFERPTTRNGETVVNSTRRGGCAQDRNKGIPAEFSEFGVAAADQSASSTQQP